jgi:hypothetical protein
VDEPGAIRLDGGLGRPAPALQGFLDPLAVERVDQAGRIPNEKGARTRDRTGGVVGCQRPPHQVALQARSRQMPQGWVMRNRRLQPLPKPSLDSGKNSNRHAQTDIRSASPRGEEPGIARKMIA